MSQGLAPGVRDIVTRRTPFTRPDQKDYGQHEALAQLAARVRKLLASLQDTFLSPQTSYRSSVAPFDYLTVLLYECYLLNGRRTAAFVMNTVVWAGGNGVYIRDSDGSRNEYWDQLGDVPLSSWRPFVILEGIVLADTHELWSVSTHREELYWVVPLGMYGTSAESLRRIAGTFQVRDATMCSIEVDANGSVAKLRSYSHGALLLLTRFLYKMLAGRAHKKQFIKWFSTNIQALDAELWQWRQAQPIYSASKNPFRHVIANRHGHATQHERWLRKIIHQTQQLGFFADRSNSRWSAPVRTQIMRADMPLAAVPKTTTTRHALPPLQQQPQSDVYATMPQSLADPLPSPDGYAKIPPGLVDEQTQTGVYAAMPQSVDDPLPPAPSPYQSTMLAAPSPPPPRDQTVYAEMPVVVAAAAAAVAPYQQEFLRDEFLF